MGIVIDKLKERFRKRSRAEIIHMKAASILRDLLLLDFSNDELASVVWILKEKTSEELKKRDKTLDINKELTKYAIEIIK